MAINWNKYPETEPKERLGCKLCLVVVEYMQNNQLQTRIQSSYFLTGFNDDQDECLDYWDGIDDDEKVTHWIFAKDIPLPNDSEVLAND